MAKEKTVTIPRGTVLAYRVLQLVIKEDCWGKWRLEAQEQQRQDSPSGGLAEGQGLLANVEQEEGEGGYFPAA